MGNTVCAGKRGNYKGDPDALYDLLGSTTNEPDLAEVQRLIDEGIDLRFKHDGSESTALMVAALGGHREVLKAILKEDPELVHVNYKDKDGMTALAYAKSAVGWEQRSSPCIELLQKYGAHC